MEKITTTIVLALMAAFAADEAFAGMALSSPPIPPITIDKFPFHYENKFRVYNQGDRDSVFAIDVITQYSDVKEWLSFDKKVFVLKPNESTQVRFNIDAQEGHTGSYDVILRPLLLPEGVTEIASGRGMQRAYIKTGIDFQITIIVPEEVGLASLGERPALKAPETQEGASLKKEAVEETLKAEKGVVKVHLDKPLSLDIPSEAVAGKEVKLSASFIGGGEPDEMGLLITSPSGKTFHLPRTTSFTFDEVGKWAVLVMIADNVVVGKAVNVNPPEENFGTGNMLVGGFIDSIPQLSGSSVMLISAMILAVALAFAYIRHKKQSS